MKYNEQKSVKSGLEKGLSTIELLISIAIFFVVMSSVYGILKIGNLSRTTTNSRSENIKNVRIALNTIGREAVNAGLGYNRIGGTVPDDFTTFNFELPPDPDTLPDLLTAISTGVNITPSDFSKNGEKNDVVAFAFRDFQFNDGFPIVINDATQSGNTLILKTPNGACANCRPYDLFLIETGKGQQSLILSTDIVNENTIVLAQDALNLNFGKCTPPGNGNGNAFGVCMNNNNIKKCINGLLQNCIDYSSTSVVAKKIYLVSYRVAADGTLIRTTFGNNTGADGDNQIVQHPIASGVRSLKIQYLMEDGTTSTDPSVANVQKEKCNDIVQIDISLTVESNTDQMGFINSNLITLNSTFSTRNLKYDVY